MCVYNLTDMSSTVLSLYTYHMDACACTYTLTHTHTHTHTTVDPEGVDLQGFSLHAVASAVGTFFRELPEPLLTQELYEEFIRSMGMYPSPSHTYTPTIPLHWFTLCTFSFSSTKQICTHTTTHTHTTQT